MITQMKKYTFLVFHRDYEAFLEQLRSLGVVHITEKASGMAEDATLQALLQQADHMRKTIAQGAPDQLLQEKANLESRIAATEKEAKTMAVWGDFSAERIEQLQRAGYSLRFFVCPQKKFNAEWGTEVAVEKGQVYFVVVEKAGEEAALSEDLQAYAAELTLSKKSSAALLQDVEGLNGLLAAQNARIEMWQREQLPAVEKEYQDTLQQIDWQRVTLNTDTVAEGALKVVEGFCTIDQTAALDSMLQEQHIYFQAEDPTVEDNTPIKLRNNWFTRMFECFTGMYGMPTYGEFDPTPILAPFYLLFFAMCMGDAGYGLVLILFGLLVHYKKVNISMFEGLGPIITTLGVGTAVVGLFLGTFFGMPLADAAWYPEALKGIIVQGTVMGYDAQMVLAICIGVFHICLAMVVKAICYTKRFGFKENISTWGWLLLIVGGLSALILLMLFNAPAEVTKWTLIAIAGVSALGIYIFNKPGRNPLLNIGAGLWDTYNMATGLLGDVLSYVRLYALGLAGGMLGGAFNNLGMMVLGDNPTWQWLPFVLILLLGHVLNIAMSALGAFVHPLRLTFVEYFKNSGYEGKGIAYQPFKK
ncbi:MAG: V-type ATPase 116kDa subunit family protein [Paludibacteraceae bacterium]|nr:V-type ATPase 116kDa subunit family protein [Paludibacteraceae bacterium]